MVYGFTTDTIQAIRELILQTKTPMAETQDAVYREFLHFDWDSYEEFQEGLSQILDGHLALLKEQDASVQLIPPAEKQQLIDQAKLFYYCTSTGNILNLDDYYAWKRNNGDKITLLEEPQEAPTINASNEEETTLSNVAGEKDAPYSNSYHQLVDLIVSGKPVPGIKQIPDTVLSDQSSKLEARSRLKPWEKQETEEKEANTSPDIQEMTL